MLQCVAVCCSVLQCVEIGAGMGAEWNVFCVLYCVAVCCGVLQSVAVCDSAIHCVDTGGVTPRCYTFQLGQHIATRCNALQHMG